MNTRFIFILFFLVGVIIKLCAQETLKADVPAQILNHSSNNIPGLSAKIEYLYDSINKRTSEFTKEDWQVIIDAWWGEGSSTLTKLNIFDSYWNTINTNYSAFQNLDVDWDGLKSLYRPEIEAGVSHGRLVAIINVLARTLMETHVFMNNGTVNYNTKLAPGVPLFALGKYGNNAHFGAALAPLPDSTLLVYKAFHDHPLGLVPGDKVLGYEGVPWKILYKKLLEAELPVNFGMMGSTEEAFTHIYLSSAGLNWHLFDTIDIVKYESGDTMHYPTSLLEGLKGRISSSDQVPVPGVDFWQTEGPDIVSLDTTDNFTWINSPDRDAEYFTWGILDNTNIGYLYVATLNNDFNPGFSADFYNAIKTLINDYHVDGLILDSRTNYGGSWSLMDNGFSMLFNEGISVVSLYERCVGYTDHFRMCEWIIPGGPDAGTNTITMSAQASTYFDRPIAVLTGPGCISAGDLFAYKIKHHPMARSFGKPTGGAFAAGMNPVELSGRPDWWIAYSRSTEYPATDSGNWLTHTGVEVDEDIWFDPDSVAKGVDNVVSRAVEWIYSKVYPYQGEIRKIYLAPGETVTPRVRLQNPNNHNVTVWAYLNDMENGMPVDSVALSIQDTDLFSAVLSIPSVEKDFSITYKSYDLDDGEEQILPNVNRFTTRGPVQVDSYKLTPSNRSGEYRLQLQLANGGTEASVYDLKARVEAFESCIIMSNSTFSADVINAGDAKTADGIIPFSTSDCSDVKVFPVQVNIYENDILY